MTRKLLGSRVLLGLISVFVSVKPAHANKHYFITVRSALQLGPWAADFTQQGLGTGVEHRAPLSPGFQFQAGFIFAGYVFADYNLTIFEPIGTAYNRARYHSYAGGNLGVALPVLPFEIYVGMETGNYGFAAGSTVFGSTTYKVGASIHFYTHESGNTIGVCAEFRRLFIGSDQAGEIPSGYVTRSDVYFAGITFAWSPANKPAKSGKP